MEDILLQVIQTGNATAILGCIIVYAIIHFQRKTTAETRNSESDKLRDEIHQLKIEKELMQKDVDYLKEENVGTKQDIKEIKATLQTMALALERIAARYDSEDKK